MNQSMLLQFKLTLYIYFTILTKQNKNLSANEIVA